jgi:hypothetical protein
MNWFVKGAEDVLDVLGIKPGAASDLIKKVEENTPEPVKQLRREVGQSYRVTPYTVMFGRYKDALGDATRKVKGTFSDLVN